MVEFPEIARYSACFSKLYWSRRNFRNAGIVSRFAFRLGDYPFHVLNALEYYTNTVRLVAKFGVSVHGGMLGSFARFGVLGIG